MARLDLVIGVWPEDFAAYQRNVRAILEHYGPRVQPHLVAARERELQAAMETLLDCVTTRPALPGELPPQHVNCRCTMRRAP